MGSSPPVRGAHTVCPIPRRPAGLIPARAGSTAAICSSVTCSGAHPRPCGEHSSSLSLPITPSGSSPPVRGARHPDRQLLQPRGLIPARAGSTVGRCGQGCGAWAHPRPCGEHERIWAVTGVDTGSSPPVRGALSIVELLIFAFGLIPARAGSTILSLDLLVCSWAHPRPCGEHSCWTAKRTV